MKKLRTRASLFLSLLIAGSLCGWVQASVFPPPTDQVFVQTNGRTNPINTGDWYSNPDNGVSGMQPANGGNTGSHFLRVLVPVNWPSGTPLHIDLLSPGWNENGNIVAPDPIDEFDGGSPPQSAVTSFELFPGNTTIDVLTPHVPAPQTGIGGSFATFAPTSAPLAWQRWYTIANPTPGGSYIIRSDSGTYNGQNSYRVRIGLDDDSDPTNPPPANASDPDGVPGTGDEPTYGLLLNTYQHNSGGTQCHTFFVFVPEDFPSITFHNFDMDNNGRMRYYPPGSTDFDPTAIGGGIAGTVSGATQWNGVGASTTNRAGDTIANPAPGFWRVVGCISNNNQYIFESSSDLNTFFTSPNRPVITLQLDAEVAAPPMIANSDLVNNEFDYTVTFTNDADTLSASERGPGVDPVFTIELDPKLEFVSATINGSYTGTVGSDVPTDPAESTTVTITLTDNPSDTGPLLLPGANGTITIRVKLKEVLDPTTTPNPGMLDSTAFLDYKDSFKQQWPTLEDPENLVFDEVLLVRLEEFTAEAIAPEGYVLVRWITSAEVGTAGFDIHRLRVWPTGESDTLVVNDMMIAPEGTEFSGAVYEVLDMEPLEADENRFYYLVETEFSGLQNTYGPAEVQPMRLSSSVQDWRVLD